MVRRLKLSSHIPNRLLIGTWNKEENLSQDRNWNMMMKGRKKWEYGAVDWSKGGKGIQNIMRVGQVPLKVCETRQHQKTTKDRMRRKELLQNHVPDVHVSLSHHFQQAFHSSSECWSTPRLLSLSLSLWPETRPNHNVYVFQIRDEKMIRWKGGEWGEEWRIPELEWEIVCCLDIMYDADDEKEGSCCLDLWCFWTLEVPYTSKHKKGEKKMRMKSVEFSPKSASTELSPLLIIQSEVQEECFSACNWGTLRKEMMIPLLMLMMMAEGIERKERCNSTDAIIISWIV